MDVVLGVDVGGTTTAAGAVTETGEVLIEDRRPTHHAGLGTAVQTTIDLIAAIRSEAERRGLRVAGIGIGVPGLVNAATGRIADEALNVPELAELPLAAMLRERFGLPVFVDNDVNALALAEFFFGVGRGVSSLVLLAAGTGFGAGLVLDGRLIRGALGFAGEFGHTPVKFDGRPCWCGGRGCLAVYASGRGIAEEARARVAVEASTLSASAGGDPTMITAPLVFAAAEAGDMVAASVVDEACRALGAMVGVIINGLNPDVVAITGGVAAAYAKLEKRVLAAAAEHAFPSALAATRVCVVPGDKSVSMRGAAALVIYETRGGGNRAASESPAV
ncbi:MAG: glucokinase [Candidatus Rokuibacteriota bacterium]|nr:MAG: glucokinase [Candidatus Rokubacteria bacterium]